MQSLINTKKQKLNEFSLRLKKLVDDKKFHALSARKRNEYVRRLQRLQRQLIASIPEFKLSKVFAYSTMVLGLIFGTVSAQQFAPHVQDPFGLTPDNAIGTTYLAAPAFVDIDNDGDFDAFFGVMDSSDYSGKVLYYQNVGDSVNPVFAVPQTNPFGIDTSYYVALPNFVDIDGDGDFDLFIGAYGNYYNSPVKYFENIGTPTSPAFGTPVINPFGITSVDYIAAQTFVDIDGDGDYDIFQSHYDTTTYLRSVYFQENTGTAMSPAFAAAVPGTMANNIFQDLVFPEFADIDGDGDFDAVFGEYDNYGNTIRYYENIGTKSVPVFGPEQNDPFGLDSLEYFAVPHFVDIDGDGDMDGMISEYYGSLKFFENTTPVGLSSSVETLDVQVYPNPVQDEFAVEYVGEVFNEINIISILDMQGRIIWQDKFLPQGKNIKRRYYKPELSAGVYLLRIKSGNSITERKLIFGNSE